MKNLTIASLLLFSFNAFGAGAIVTDPTSYGFYLQQIVQGTKQVVEAKKTVENLGGLRDQVDEMTSQFRGNYARAMGIVGAVGDLYKEVESIPSSIEAGKANFESMIGDYQQYAKVDENLKAAFNDPRSALYNPDVYLTYKYNVKQLSKKNVIRTSEDMLAKQKDRIKKLAEISGQIDETENVKDATDLNNRFAAEFIKGQLELIAIVSRIAKMLALEGYAGYEDDTAAAAVAKAKKRAKGTENAAFTNWVMSHEEK